MTFPTNDDFSNCELSIEELEAIAAGWPGWVRTIGRGLETAGHVAASVVNVVGNAIYVGTVVSAAVIVGGAIFGGDGQKSTHLN